MEDNKISFDITFCCSALNLLNSLGDPDLGPEDYVLDGVLSQLRQWDPAFEDALNAADCGTILDDINFESEMFQKCLSFEMNGVEINYTESVNYDDRGDVAFRVPCTFDIGKYMELAGLDINNTGLD